MAKLGTLEFLQQKRLGLLHGTLKKNDKVFGRGPFWRLGSHSIRLVCFGHLAS